MPEMPRELRKKLIEYQKEGFTMRSIERRKGSHFYVQFEEVDGKHLISYTKTEHRTEKNFLARLRRMLRAKQQQQSSIEEKEI